LRRVLPHPVTSGEQKGIALQDPFMLSGQTMVIPIQAAGALQHFNGEWTQEEIASNLKAPPEIIEALVGKLDELGLLWGPTATGLESSLRSRIEDEGAIPLRQSQMLGDSEEAARKALDAMMAEAENPELPFEPTGLVMPRIDYQAASHVYAGGYHAVNGMEYDRVVVLGNNQFGFGEGVIASPWSFQSPLGVMPVDAALLDALTSRLGPALTADALDHIASADIEMQIPWIQHTLGTTPVLGFLLPDPLDSGTGEGDRVEVTAWAQAMHAALHELGGRTLVISAGDLSHIGPQFGEPRPIDDQRMSEAERADRELLATFAKGDAAAFVSSVKWHANALRWSGVGAMAGLLELIQPSSVELIDYHQHALDEEGAALVATAGIAVGG